MVYLLQIANVELYHDTIFHVSALACVMAVDPLLIGKGLVVVSWLTAPAPDRAGAQQNMFLAFPNQSTMFTILTNQPRFLTP